MQLRRSSDRKPDHREEPWIDGADVAAGAPLPIDLVLEMQLTDKTAPEGDDQHVPLSLQWKILKRRKYIEKWLATDAKNALLLAADPLAAAKAAGLRLSASEEEFLRRVHASEKAHDILPAGVRVAKLDVTFAPEKKEWTS